MPRVNVWVPDELHRAAQALPGVNWSAAIQAGLRDLLECPHDELSCSSCGHPTTATALRSSALESFYRQLLTELALLVQSAGTVEGAARVARKVALAHGIAGAAQAPLPRLSRARRAQVADTVALPTEAGARHRHPTNHQPQEHTA